MTAWKRIIVFGVGVLLLGVTAARAQINVTDLRALKQRYINEYLGCSDMSAIVSQHISTPVGQGWGGYSPTEWYRAADLTHAAGCGNNSGESRLQAALDYAENRAIENWWEREIGVPWALAQGLLRGGGSIRSDLRTREVNALKKFIGMQSLTETNGANTVWRGWARLLAAMYLEDTALAQGAIDLMTTATSQGDFAHIQHDWSYFFHYDVLNMHYGGQHFGDYAWYLQFTENTPFAVNARVNPNDAQRRTGLELTLLWFKNFLRWIYYQGYADPFTSSKFPHKQNSYGGRIKRGADFLARTGYPEVGSYRSALSEVSSNSANPLGARAFPQARYLVVRRAGFYGSLMMANLVEPHMEASSVAPIFGAVNIVTPASKEKWSEQAVYNYPRALLNAMTVPAEYEDATYEAASQYSGREDLGAITGMLRNWGYYGVSTLNGYYGLGAESLTDGGNNFSFKRSWFFFEDEIVCVGSGINANTSGLGGMKTLLYTSASHGGAFSSSNGSHTAPTGTDSERQLGALLWLQQNDMGYYFPGSANVSAEGLGANYSRVYLDHGATPSNAAFAAVLLPNYSAAEVQNYVNTGGVEILQRDAAAHVVRHRSSNVVAVAAFAPLSRNELTTNLPGYVLYQNASNKFGLSLYNPHRETALSNNTVDDRVNSMVDHQVTRPSAHAYKVQVPFRVRKGSGKGMELFEVNELSANRTEITVNLRVYRKFEIAGTMNGEGAITINSAWIAWNDAAEDEPATPPPTNRFPVAIINGAPNGYVGEALNFNGANSYDPDGGGIVNYAWRFGDNTSASGANVAHAFTAPGNYALSLEVTDDEGAKSEVAFEVNIQTQPASGEQLRVLVSSDDKYEIYINGLRLGANASWTSAEEYRVPLLDGKNVIALKAENWDQAGALLAEVHALNKLWPSDTKWKVSLSEENGWAELTFDDSGWIAATSHGAHGVALPWAQFQNVTGISTDKGVQWIWSADKRQDHVVYLRFTFSPGADTQAPAAPTGVRIGLQ